MRDTQRRDGYNHPFFVLSSIKREFPVKGMKFQWNSKTTTKY